nr:hypothetical protein [uncultured Methanoregula sp.]
MKNIQQKKKAILFGGTDGHGITMTAISERALKCQGYDVETICRYPDKTLSLPLTIDPTECGTGIPEYFWAFTFTNWDYSLLGPGDIIMIVDIPLPIPQQISEFSAAEKGVEKIRQLCSDNKRVILIDHHKHALTHYGKAIDAGAELQFSLGPVKYTHFGIPDDYTLFWGSIGAVCDRDPSTLPIEPEETDVFAMLELQALWLDKAKLDLNKTGNPLDIIRNDDRQSVTSDLSLESQIYAFDKAVTFVPELGKLGLKKLDAACAKNNTPYGVGIGINRENQHYIVVINYWKLDSIPVALKLHKWRDIAGHDSAVTIPMKNRQSAEKNAKKIIAILNSNGIGTPGQKNKDPDVIDYLVGAIEKSHSDIPVWLTIHGWPHIETVFANTQLLGTLMNCSKADQTILNWSALFHDLGNGANQYAKECSLNEEYTKDNKTVRKFHHLLTVDILKCWRKKGFCKAGNLGNELITDDDFQTICELCFRHRKDSEKHMDPAKERLCSLLRIADALDKTKSRARKNDSGDPASKVLKNLAIQNTPDSWESIKNWEGQLAIETIRLHITQKNKQNHIVFEFLVTDRQKAGFMIEDFKKELKTLDKNIATWDVKTVLIPLFN